MYTDIINTFILFKSTKTALWVLVKGYHLSSSNCRQKRVFQLNKRYQTVLESNISFSLSWLFPQCNNRKLPRPLGMFTMRMARYTTIFWFQTFNDCYISNFFSPSCDTKLDLCLNVGPLMKRLLENVSKRIQAEQKIHLIASSYFQKLPDFLFLEAAYPVFCPVFAVRTRWWWRRNVHAEHEERQKSCAATQFPFTSRMPRC